MSHNKTNSLKIIIIGQSNVGKTSLTNQYVWDTFSPEWKFSIGVEFYKKEIIVNDEAIELQIWEASGRERFRSLGVSFYRGSDAAILVYDITDNKSFQEIELWRDEVLLQLSIKESQSFPFLLLANKCDLVKKKYDETEYAVVYAFCSTYVSADIIQLIVQQFYRKPCVGELYAEKYKMSFYQISAKTGENVNRSFMEIATLALTAKEKTHQTPQNTIPDNINVGPVCVLV